MTERKILLPTGADRGIRHAAVKYFNAVGWWVFTASRQSWVSECSWADGKKDYVHLDPEDVPDVEANLGLVREKLGDGRLHTLVDNAGISPKGEGNKRLGVLEADYAIWLRVFSVNLFSAVLLARGLFAELEAVQGTVINVTSIVGSKARPPAGVAYATSKATLSTLTHEMVYDFDLHGVWVNTIAPGEIDTSILSSGTERIVERSTPLHRLDQSEEIASLAYLLCTSGVSYVSGAEIHVNGRQHV